MGNFKKIRLDSTQSSAILDGALVNEWFVDLLVLVNLRPPESRIRVLLIKIPRSDGGMVIMEKT